MNRRLVFKQWIALGLLVAAHVGFAAYFWREEAIAIGDFGGFICLGLLVSQPILFAFWAAFAPQPTFSRLLCSFSLCVLIAFFEEAAALRSTHSGIGMLMTGQVAILLVATAVLSIVRWIFHWQITRTTVETAHSDYRGSQFGVKHLLILTTIIAVGCGLLRSLVIAIPHLKHLRSLYLGNDIMGLLLELVGGLFTAMCLLLPVTFVPWYTMASRPRMLFLIVTTLYIGVVCDLAIYFIMRKDFIGPMLFLQLGAGLSVLISTLVMRLFGFRMVRVARSGRRIDD